MPSMLITPRFRLIMIICEYVALFFKYSVLKYLFFPCSQICSSSYGHTQHFTLVSITEIRSHAPTTVRIVGQYLPTQYHNGLIAINLHGSKSIVALHLFCDTSQMPIGHTHHCESNAIGSQTFAFTTSSYCKYLHKSN